MTISSIPASLDLSGCDREPIHIPGTVQSHGWLFVVAGPQWRITQVSANMSGLTSRTPAEVLGQTLDAVIGRAAVEALTEALERGLALNVTVSRVFGVSLACGSGVYNASVHTFDNRTLVEIEAVRGSSGLPPLDLVQAMLSQLQRAHSLSELCNEMVGQLRELIGFDRTMIYRFLPDGTGQVIAESLRSGLEPLLNLHYPASDIPQQARELYLRNWIRLIKDAGSAPVPILALPGEDQRPLDLSHATLRSVSPIHIEYLKNMGVNASMSISIIVEGSLWGLIACHHGTARHVPANFRAAAELMGQVFSLQIQTVQGIESYVTMRAARALLDRVVSELPLDADLVDELSNRLDAFTAFIPCDGIGVWIDGRWRGAGDVPPASEISALAAFVHTAGKRAVFATHRLAHDYPQCEDWPAGLRGVLAVPLSYTADNYLFFFRKEARQVVTWGGNPEKPAVVATGASRLSPRQSFEIWKQEVRGQSLAWTSRQKLVAEAIRAYLLDIVVRFAEVIREERREAQQRQRLAIGAHNQRVKSLMELIQSLVQRGAEDAQSVESYVRSLSGRIRSVAVAHEASTAGQSGLRQLVETALADLSESAARLEITGPDVALDPKAHSVLALVLHEMSRHAAGADETFADLATLSVSWTCDAAGLTLAWDERQTREMARPPLDAIAAIIVNRKIPFDLGGQASIVRDPGGIRARFVVPARYFETTSVHTGSDTRSAQPPARLEGYDVLLVEDQMLVALEIERMLRERGAAKVTSVGSIEAAMERLKLAPPDVAVLDVDLGHETSFALAHLLLKIGVPFVFMANAAERNTIPSEFHDIGVSRKPCAADDLADTIRQALLPYLIRAVLGKPD